MENEIMNTEEVMDEAVEVAEETSGKGWKIAAGVGLAVLIGVGCYKLGRKIAMKIKAKKEAAAAIEAECVELEADEEVSE